PIARLRIKVYQNYLLPRSQTQFSVIERYGQAWTQKRRSHVRISIVISPALMMLIVSLLRRHSFEGHLDIMHEAGFKFDRGQAGSRANHNQRNGAVADTRATQDTYNSFCYVDDIRISLGAQFYGVRFDSDSAHAILLRS